MDKDTPSHVTDSGYAWVILCAAFFIQLAVNGICCSYGIFFLAFLDHFGKSKDTTSWVGSVQGGTYLVMGVAAAALSSRFGYRVVCIVGSVLSCCGLILSSFAQSINVLILTYGLLTGVGFGLMYTPSLIMVGLYFDKRRAMASGIALCGTGIGTFVIAPLADSLIETYSWRGATWILAGICLNCMICGSLLRPITIINTDIREMSPPAEDSAIQCSDHVGDGDQTEIKLGISKDMIQLNSSNGLLSVELTQTKVAISLGGGSSPSDDSQLHPTLIKTVACQWGFDQKDVVYKNSEEDRHKAHDSISNYISKITAISSLSGPRRSVSCPNVRILCKSAKQKCIAKFGTTLALFKQPSFCIYQLSSFLSLVGYVVPFTYISDMATTKGISRHDAVFLISIIGISTTVGRIFLGWIADRPWTNTVTLHICEVIIGGVAIISCPLMKTYPIMGTVIFVFGFFTSACFLLQIAILIELVGMDMMPISVGITTLCCGLAAFIAAPIAGALYVATTNYNVPFYLSGITLIVAGIICIPLRSITNGSQNQAAMKTSNVTESVSKEMHDATPNFTDEAMLY